MSMGLVFRSALALGLAAVIGLPALAQGERCTRETLAVDGLAIGARFCVPAGAPAGSVVVSETFTALGKTITKTASLVVVAGAVTSRTLDDVDLTPVGLEHALALPGAIPVK
jgi:hypothetical protein